MNKIKVIVWAALLAAIFAPIFYFGRQIIGMLSSGPAHDGTGRHMPSLTTRGSPPMGQTIRLVVLAHGHGLLTNDCHSGSTAL